MKAMAARPAAPKPRASLLAAPWNGAMTEVLAGFGEVQTGAAVVVTGATGVVTGAALVQADQALLVETGATGEDEEDQAAQLVAEDWVALLVVLALELVHSDQETDWVALLVVSALLVVEDHSDQVELAGWVAETMLVVLLVQPSQLPSDGPAVTAGEAAARPAAAVRAMIEAFILTELCLLSSF